MTGKRPYNLTVYKLAMRHSSAALVNEHGLRESNERLEYLGDAILGMVVAEFLFVRFPFKEEGFLTEIRSKIVNRETLNQVSRKIGLHDLITYHQTSRTLSPKSIYGDSLEALIGAVYLDKGFQFCKHFIVRKLIIPHYDLNELINTVTNHKSKIIEWSQKENKNLIFEIIEVKESKKLKQFTAQVIIDDEPMEVGHGLSKKKAEQDAARKTLELISTEPNE
ncbi:MAG: ribonuclease III [Cyclobacteriaceae bacterium]